MLQAYSSMYVKCDGKAGDQGQIGAWQALIAKFVRNSVVFHNATWSEKNYVVAISQVSSLKERTCGRRFRDSFIIW
ncbi:hypothetical protein DAI22_08g074850 [Oryza sativa Japonica Group]|nr:hypothetical protein DAI22_08g074850 [Oryza sativa Japonica Group]